MRILVIHPNDPSTQFLNVLYKDLPNVTKMDEHNSNKEITDAIRFGNYDLFMFLGHGGEEGLYAPTGSKYEWQQFGRDIINSGHVQFLRDKLCFGIWCNANIFAAKYNLTGIFSGMVISEIAEAYMWNIPVTDQEEMSAHNQLWSSALKECFDSGTLEDIPNKMYSYISNRKMTALEEFNFNSIWYFNKGEEQE